jgi:HlyD family secretion protein
MSQTTASAPANTLEGLRIAPEKKRRSLFGPPVVLAVIVAIIGGLGFMYVSTKGGDSQRLATKKVASGSASGQTPTGSVGQGSVPERLTPDTSEKGARLFQTSGYIVPRERIELSPRFQATVSEILVGKGDKVEAGDILVRLEDVQYRAQIAEAEARVKRAEAALLELQNGTRPQEIERLKWTIRQWEANLRNAESTLLRREELVRLNSASMEQVDEAHRARDTSEAQLNAARAELALAEAGVRAERIAQAQAELETAKAAVETTKILLRWCTIAAPISGTILTRDVDAGELVSPQSFGGSRGPSTSFLSMADLSDLQIQVDLNEQFTSQVFLDQLCEVSPLAYADKKYMGYVFEIAPEANRAKGTLEVKVQVLNPDVSLTPELSAQVSFLNAKSDEAATDRATRKRRTQ